MSNGTETVSYTTKDGQPSDNPNGNGTSVLPGNSRVIDQWREQVISPWSWRRCPNQAGALALAPRAEAGGFFAVCESLGGCRAYLKPLRQANYEGQVRAAREKIVADLAHDLNILVPPVLLYERDHTPSGEERFVCLSRVLFARQWSWQQVKQLIVASSNDEVTAIIMTALSNDPARALALDAWVSQPDHNDHPHNIVFGYDPKAVQEGRFVFLDYAWSLGYHYSRPPFAWNNDGWRDVQCPPFPPHMLRFLNRQRLNKTVEQIESMDNQTIEQIVNRIPVTFLPEDQRHMIVTGLLGRKTLVRQAVRQYLPPS